MLFTYKNNTKNQIDLRRKLDDELNLLNANLSSIVKQIKLWETYNKPVTIAIGAEITLAW